jgi:phosphatidate cytidylyltransferase
MLSSVLLSNALVPLSRILKLFIGLFTVGTLATLPMFHFKWHTFVRSSLFIKIIHWIPIAFVFTIALYLGTTLRLVLILGILALALTDATGVAHAKQHGRLIATYYAIFSLAFLHFYFLNVEHPTAIVNLLITTCFASVMSDVLAFFCGKYIGSHALPNWLNPNKSWEGVIGQLLGSFLGVVLVNTFVEPVISIWLFVPIGLGSALGDLSNSFIKRRLSIKDWSQAIPGHGGYLDRLSSLAGSALLTFYALALFMR